MIVSIFFTLIWYKVLSRKVVNLKMKSFNLKKLLQRGILAAFLLSWSAAANATVLCQCEEGHITVENIHTGYCDIDFNHDHSAPGHSDITCDCDDTSISMGTANTAKTIDFNFTTHQPLIKPNTDYRILAPDQNLLSYISRRDRLAYNMGNRLRTIILII